MPAEITSTTLPLTYRLTLLAAIAWLLVIIVVMLGAVAGLLLLLITWWSAAWPWVNAEGFSAGRFFLYLCIPACALSLLAALLRAMVQREDSETDAVILPPNEAPELVKLISELVALVNAPLPRRIVLLAEPNAAAHATGLWQHYHLHLGLPLFAVFSQQQLAGVILHELGHFRQGWTMRLQRWMNRLDAWIIHTFHQLERQVHFWMEQAGQREPWAGLIPHLLRWVWIPFVWLNCLTALLARYLAAILMLLSRLVTLQLLRQQEYNADQYEAQLVGTDCFVQTCRDLVRMNLVLDQVTEAWRHRTRHGDTAVDYEALWQKAIDRAPPKPVEAELADTTLQRFATHPPTGLRIHAVKQSAHAPQLHLEGPASVCFPSYTTWASKVMKPPAPSASPQ